MGHKVFSLGHFLWRGRHLALAWILDTPEVGQLGALEMQYSIPDLHSLHVTQRDMLRGSVCPSEKQK